MESIEATGETVEEAVANGVKELGVGPGDVMIEVLEEPNRGLFGLGSKPARVRLVLIGGRRSEPPPPSPDVDESPPPPVEDEPEEQVAVTSDEWDDDARIGHEVLSELLEKMDIRSTIEVRRAEANRDGEDPPWVLNITGKNVRLLIGRRGNTLASLQYVTRLIASRRLQRRSNIVVDAGDYKSERSDRLKRLANRMADQAIRQRRTVTLEPMPPNERRIIHLALRNREDVATKSVGEGNSRKVTIVPK